MTDLSAAIAAAREVLADIDARGMSFIAAERTTLIDTMRNLLSALDAAQGEAVPAKGLRDSALNSARFRARCYALVGIVEGIAGLGRRWASDGERLKDTPEWVAFYNSVSAMRNGIAEPTSATQAPPAAVPAPSVEGRTVKEAWWAGARAALGIEDDTPRDQVASAFLTAAERAAQQPAAVANVTPMRQPRLDLARLADAISAAVYANGDGLSVTEAIGALELAKLELLKEQEQ